MHLHDVRLEFVGIFKQYLVLFTFTQSPVHHHCADSICDISILDTVDQIFLYSSFRVVIKKSKLCGLSLQANYINYTIVNFRLLMKY
jgi:hypothetical protein